MLTARSSDESAAREYITVHEGARMQKRTCRRKSLNRQMHVALFYPPFSIAAVKIAKACQGLVNLISISPQNQGK